jgi:hypothetical protein
MAFNFNEYRNYTPTPTDYYKIFESKFEARIEDSREYKQYVRRMPYNMWDGKIPFETEAQVVPMKAIHLTTDNLDRLVREQEHIEHLQSDADYGKRLWKQERTDQRVRDENPAVAKAYRNYLALLELARK